MTSPTPLPSPELTLAAGRILEALTGWRWTWPPHRVTDVYRVPYSTRTIKLYGRPVSAVHSVAGPTGEIIDPSLYQLYNGTQIWFLQPQDWWFPGALYDIAAPPPWWNMSWYGTRQFPDARDIAVDYTYGSPPAIEWQRAIQQLAQQFQWAEDCDGRCQLPERVTNVIREGISYTLIDPQEFLDNGKTGLYFVDLVIAAYSGRGKGGSVGVVSVELPPPRRIADAIVG